jgi:hypothetical protein
MSIFGDYNVYKDEPGIIQSYNDIINEVEIILFIGVVSGISPVHNCKKNRVGKAIIGIDGSRDQIALDKDNARLNGVDSSKFLIIEGIIILTRLHSIGLI